MYWQLKRSPFLVTTMNAPCRNHYAAGIDTLPDHLLIPYTANTMRIVCKLEQSGAFGAQGKQVDHPYAGVSPVASKSHAAADGGVIIVSIRG